MTSDERWLLASDGHPASTGDTQGTTWVTEASREQSSDFCTPAKIPESVFIERYKDTDRRHLPIDTKTAREPHSVFADVMADLRSPHLLIIANTTQWCHLGKPHLFM